MHNLRGIGALALSMSFLVAQERPGVAEMAQRTHELVAELQKVQDAGGAGAEHDKLVAAAKQAIEQHIAPLLARTASRSSTTSRSAAPCSSRSPRPRCASPRRA
jgi:hypothetical protein